MVQKILLNDLCELLLAANLTNKELLSLFSKSLLNAMVYTPDNKTPEGVKSQCNRELSETLGELL